MVIHPVSQLPAGLSRVLQRTPLLERPALSVGILCAAAAVVVGWNARALWERRHRYAPAHRAVRRALLSCAVALLLVGGSAIGVNAYVGYVPNLTELQGSVPGSVPLHQLVTAEGPGHRRLLLSHAVVSLRSTVVSMTVSDPALDIDHRPVEVYLPPGYFAPANRGRHYPVVYLLHGYPGRAVDWIAAGDLHGAADMLTTRGLIQPMIVVMPQVANSPFTDSECLNLPGREQDETFLSDTLVTRIDSLFRTQADRGGRVIGGMSSGGYCALNLALRHPDVFSVALSLEPFGDPGRKLIRALGLPQWQADSPRLSLQGRHLGQPLAVYLGAGGDDAETRPQAESLAKQLAAAGAYVGLDIDPGGGHTWHEAARQLPLALVFADHHLTAAAPLSA